MNTRALIDLIALSAIWGASFLLIKIGVAEVSPFTFAAWRVIVGAATLFAVLKVRGVALPRQGRAWRAFAVTGLLGVALPFAAISWGTQHIASGLSAILNASMPLFTVILAAAIGEERLTARRVAGVLAGFAGIVVLTLPNLRGGLDVGLLGELAVVLAALSYAVSILYARRRVLSYGPLTASFGQVAMGAVWLLPAMALEQPWAAAAPSWRVVAAVLAIGVLGTGIAYIIYYRLLAALGPTGTSLVTFIVPLFGIFWGWAILQEYLSWHAFAALGLIVSGLVLVNGLPTARRRPVPAPAGE